MASTYLSLWPMAIAEQNNKNENISDFMIDTF
jgi:hypothetical protein